MTGCTAECTERMRQAEEFNDDAVMVICAEFARQLQELQAENDKLRADNENRIFNYAALSSVCHALRVTMARMGCSECNGDDE